MINISSAVDRQAGYYFVCSNCGNCEHEVPQHCHHCGAEVSIPSLQFAKALEDRQQIKRMLVLEESNLKMLLNKSTTITTDERCELNTMLQQNAAAQMALETEYN